MRVNTLGADLDKGSLVELEGSFIELEVSSMYLLLNDSRLVNASSLSPSPEKMASLASRQLSG
jgi:hypothetical protein